MRPLDNPYIKGAIPWIGMCLLGIGGTEYLIYKLLGKKG